MEKYRLTPEEVLLIDLLFLASVEEGHKEYLIKYCSLPIAKTNLRQMLLDLQDKGIITKQYQVPDVGQTFDPECVIFNKNFLKNYKKFSGDLGAEFLMNYPHNGVINGTEVVLNNFAKKFSSEEDFYFAYGKSIGWNEETHHKIMKLIKWGKDNNCNLLNMNIADFMISKIWKNVEELQNGDGVMFFDNVANI